MKPRRSRLPLLFAAILAPCAALAALGVHALATEASQTEQRYRQRAEGALDEAVAAVEATARDVPQNVDGALRFVTTPSGEVVEPEPRAESRASSRGDEGAAVDLLLSVLTEVDRLERSGDLERASARIGEFLSSHPPSDLAAAALTAVAAIEKKRGRIDAAKSAWGAIVSEHPEARDSRGLKRSFSARLALAEQHEAGAPELFDLYLDVVDDDLDGATPATSAFKREVRARLVGLTHGKEDVLVKALLRGWGLGFADSRDRKLTPRRELGAALAGGVRAWFAGGGRGVKTVLVPAETVAAADASTEPVRVVVSARDAPDGRIAGAIAPLESVIAAALARREIKALESVGFSVGVQSGPGKGLIPPRSVGDALGGVMLGVIGADLETFRKQERTRFLVTASLAGLGLLVATLAAIATTRAVRREVRAARDRENFVAAVTHELKAPLASIRLLAEVLWRGGVEEAKVREFSERAIGECDRLGRLVSSVLELARIEGEPAMLLKLRTVDAGALARDVVRTFEPVARKHGFSVSLRIVGAPLQVAGDKDALVGALLNLLDNAVKYSAQPGEVELEVAAAGRHHAAFSVLDRGPGVPAAEARRIFEPFIRLGDEMTRGRPGVGLGLALVSRIASAHGGTAACKSRAGGGSRFTVVLPIADRVGERARAP